MFDYQFLTSINLQLSGLQAVRSQILNGFSNVRVPIDIAVSPRSLAAVRQQLSQMGAGLGPINVSVNVSSVASARSSIAGLTASFRTLGTTVASVQARLSSLAVPPAFQAMGGSIRGVNSAIATLNANINSMTSALRGQGQRALWVVLVRCKACALARLFV